MVVNHGFLNIGTNTSGGSSYLARIIKVAQTADHINIVLLAGKQQKYVHKALLKQLDELHQVTDVHFTHSIQLCQAEVDPFEGES